MCISDRNYECAALAINKALIGIAELSLAENASAENKYGSFRIFKAFQTYYVAYNIMASYMILANHLSDKIKSNYKKVDILKLNSTDESPKAWKEQGNYEQDLSTLIGHSGIKKFCDSVRSKNIDITDSALKFLSTVYIDNGAKCLYEKLCYIRDRTVYRPSFVITTTDTAVQTSKYVRQEIDSLPNSSELYEDMKKYISLIPDIDSIDSAWFYSVFRGQYITSDKNYLDSSLNIKATEIKKLINTGIMDEDLSVPSFICQLLELEPVNIVIDFYRSFWLPLFDKMRPLFFPKHNS